MRIEFFTDFFAAKTGEKLKGCDMFFFFFLSLL